MALDISEDHVVTLLKNALTHFGRCITKIAPITKGLLENVDSRGHPVAVDLKAEATLACVLWGVFNYSDPARNAP